jgi:hypothetical protein
MSDPRFLSTEELKPFGANGSDLADRARALVRQQTGTWPLLQTGASTLGSVVVKEIAFPHFSMKVQFNPGRITSTAAKVDKESIAERRCFLCMDNLPPQQRGIETGEYVVLCNPFPIFPEHFTIPHRDHIDQRIPAAFSDMLRITREMGSRYSLFYNGPRCGASAPDHLHFQAGDFGFMTIDTTWESLVEPYGEWVVDRDGLRVAAIDDTLRRFVVIESADQNEVEAVFARLFDAFGRHNPDPDEEPMVNVLTAFRDGRWRVIVFLRRRHRPEQFFREGDDRIVFSPASVDFGGVCITPVEKDFHLMDAGLLTDMFGQLSATREVFDDAVDALRSV